MSAPTICTRFNAAGFAQKYDPTNTAVAVQPRYSITISSLAQATASITPDGTL
jgi:hypothetical protein